MDIRKPFRRVVSAGMNPDEVVRHTFIIRPSHIWFKLARLTDGKKNFRAQDLNNG